MKRTLKWYEPVGNAEIMEWERYIHYIRPVFYEFPEAELRRLSELKLPVVLTLKEQNKTFWNGYEIEGKPSEIEIVEGQLKALSEFGDGNLYEYENDQISGVAFVKNSKEILRIVNHTLKELNLTESLSESIKYQKGHDWGRSIANKGIHFNLSHVKARIILYDNKKMAELNKSGEDKNAMVVNQQDRTIQNFNMTNREALILLLTIVEDLKEIEKERDRYGDEYVEKDGGLEHIKELAQNIDLIVNSISLDLRNILEPRVDFNLMSLDGNYMIDNLSAFRYMTGFMTTQIRQLNDLLSSSFPDEDLPIANPQDKQKLQSLYNTYQDRLKPFNMFAVELSSAEFQRAWDNKDFGSIELPWLQEFYPEIASELQTMNPEIASEVKRNMLGLIKGRFSMFPRHISKYFMDSIVYSGFMMTFSNRED